MEERSKREVDTEDEDSGRKRMKKEELKTKEEKKPVKNEPSLKLKISLTQL